MLVSLTVVRQAARPVDSKMAINRVVSSARVKAILKLAINRAPDRAIHKLVISRVALRAVY